MIARRSLDALTQQEASVSIVDPILQTLLENDVRTVGGYLALSGELDLDVVLQRLVDLGIAIVLPVCGPEASLEFCPWVPGDTMSEGPFGIREPRTCPAPVSTIDAFLVPGVGFAEDGSRVGHGAGYYDRFFARCFSADHYPLRLGIAHDLQVVDLPKPESWDVAMHQIITPSRVIHVDS